MKRLLFLRDDASIRSSESRAFYTLLSRLSTHQVRSQGRGEISERTMQMVKASRGPIHGPIVGQFGAVQWDAFKLAYFSTFFRV
jgi:hypothetical protein